MFSVYVISNIVNGKQYVGITKMTVRRRFQKHQSEARKGAGWVLQKAMRKHGFAAFVVDTIAVDLDRAAAGLMEQQVIAELRTRPPGGYNLTEGGDGARGYRHTEEWKAELSRRTKGRKQKPEVIEAHRQKMIGYSPTIIARTNMSKAQTGRKHPTATIQKMSESAIRRWQENPKPPVTEEERTRLQNLAVGVKRTPEHRAAVSAALKGKPKSPEHRAKLSEARRVAWTRKNETADAKAI